MAVMWHGGNRWSGTPEIRPAKGGRAEWGPGLYGSTSYFRAASYAKGGKVTHLIEYNPRLLLGDAAIGLDLARDFVRDNAPRSKQADILEFLAEESVQHRISDKFTVVGNGKPFLAGSLLNLWVNSGLASGVRGPALSEFFSQHGIDAYSDSVSGLNGERETWTVIFNPDAITENHIITASDVPDALWTLPDPRDNPDETVSGLYSEVAPAQKRRTGMRMG